MVFFYYQQDVCVINGVCYQDGYVNPKDIRQVCYTRTSTSTWSVLTSKSLFAQNDQLECFYLLVS